MDHPGGSSGTLIRSSARELGALISKMSIAGNSRQGGGTRTLSRDSVRTPPAALESMWRYHHSKELQMLSISRGTRSASMAVAAAGGDATLI